MGGIEALSEIARSTNEYLVRPTVSGRRTLLEKVPALGPEVKNVWHELPRYTREREILKDNYAEFKQKLGATKDNYEFGALIALKDFYEGQSEGWKIVDFLLYGKYRGYIPHEFRFEAFAESFSIIVPSRETSVSFHFNDPNPRNPVRIDINTFNHERDNSLMYEARDLVEEPSGYYETFNAQQESEFGLKRFEITRRVLSSMNQIYERGLIQTKGTVLQEATAILRG